MQTNFTLFVVKVFTFFSARSAAFGGTGGVSFDDVQSQNEQIVGVRAIRVRHGLYVESLRAEYISIDGSIFLSNPTHGGTLAPEIRIPFQTGEVLTEVRGLTDHFFVNELTFITTDGSGVMRGYSLHGQITGLTSFTVRERVIGFYGRGGGFINAIGFYYIGLFLDVAWWG